MSVLVREEFIEQLEDKKYRLGMRAFLIGKAYEDHVGTWHFCVPYLEKIRDTINENTVFGSWVDGIPKILYRAESRLGFRSVTAIGSSRPINSSAIGKALAGINTQLDFRNDKIDAIAKVYIENDCGSPKAVFRVCVNSQTGLLN